MASSRLSPAIPDDVRHALQEFSPLVAQLLYARGITTADAARDFIAPNFDTGRHDPFLMTDMDKSVARILEAIRANEHIAIWSDYDCDGIPGGVVLHDFFVRIGFTNFENYIPHRHNEGFGLNREGIDLLASRGTTLLISIDCGITNVEEVTHALSRGIDVIITDHHEPGLTLPPAYAILDPKRDTAYPFRELCGSGVIWKLVEGLIARGSFALPAGTEKWLLDMVGLATLSDMVPLVGENRVLAHFGLTVLRKTPRAGLRELLRKVGAQQHTLTEDDIGFSIAPRINAASRMGDPRDAFLLFTSSTENASFHADKLEHTNNERKGHVGVIVKEINKRLKEREHVPPVIVLGNPEWRPSLLGLVANSIVSEYRRPVFLWGRDGRDVLKGSCRTDGSASVVTLMHEVKDALLEYGGHHASGGFAIRETHVHTLGSALNEAYERVRGSGGITGELTIDADLSLSEVSTKTLRDMSMLSPFGVGNPKPLFRFGAVTVGRVEQFGKTKEHLKVVMHDERNSVEAMSFFARHDSFTKVLHPGETVDIIGHIESSSFRGRTSLRVRIVDVH